MYIRSESYREATLARSLAHPRSCRSWPCRQSGQAAAAFATDPSPPEACDATPAHHPFVLRPFETVYSPLSYSGNPGVKRRISQGLTCCANRPRHPPSARPRCSCSRTMRSAARALPRAYVPSLCQARHSYTQSATYRGRELCREIEQNAPLHPARQSRGKIVYLTGTHRGSLC